MTGSHNVKMGFTLINGRVEIPQWMTNGDGTLIFSNGRPIALQRYANIGGADQGQPTRFLPRRNRFVFKVRVPDGFRETDELIWTLTSQGQTERAYATLRPDYFTDNVVIMSETGSLGAGTSNPEVRANIPPSITLEGPSTRTARVGEPFTLVAVVKDDGVPRRRGGNFQRPGGGRGGRGEPPSGAVLPPAALRPPGRITVGKRNGLHLSWFVYRGAGQVAFDPRQVKVWEDTRTGANSPWAPLWVPPPVPEGGRYETRITFAEPGTYVLRARADDGGLFSDESVTVTSLGDVRRRPRHLLIAGLSQLCLSPPATRFPQRRSRRPHARTSAQ